MTHRAGPDDICAMCDEFSLRGADPAKPGTGVCQVAETGRPLRHIEWNGRTCVSFRLDRANIELRRQYVQTQQEKETPP